MMYIYCLNMNDTITCIIIHSSFLHRERSGDNNNILTPQIKQYLISYNFGHVW